EKNDQVILPGLGSFFIKRIEGYFDEEQNTFFPPKETIEFSTSEQPLNPNYKDVLIAYISSSKNISTTSSSYILTKYIEDLKKKLEETEEVPLENIGKLKLQNSEITFEAEKEQNLGNSFFGLPAFKISSEKEQ